jgi:hypothetical protein
MRRLGMLAAGLALAACSPELPPSPVKPVPVKTPPPAMAPSPATPATSEPLVKEIMELPPRPPAKPAPAVELAPRPSSRSIRTPTPGQIYLPSFTFRTLDHAHVNVTLNGEELSTTPCLWTIAESIAFDPKISVPDWPPSDAKFIGTTQSPEAPSGRAELYLSDDKSLAVRFPHLAPDECVLYVRGTLGSHAIQGALRLLVEGYRYTVYTPLVDPEGELASKFLRTLWFERKRSE